MEKLSRFRPLPDPRLPPMVGCAMCHLKLDTTVFTTPTVSPQTKPLLTKPSEEINPTNITQEKHTQEIERENQRDY